jgi:hypothetical protein
MLLTPTPPFRALRRVARAALGIVILAVTLVAPAVVAAATATTTTVSAAQSTIVAGDTVAITAAVSPGPGGGTVTFTSSQFGVLGTAIVDPETNLAGISPTLAPGIHVITATFNGFGDFTPSTSAPVTVTATLGTTGGTPTSTSVSVATPGASEGQLTEIRATVAPIPNDGRVQFMEGNRLLATAPIDPTTGQAILSISTLAAGTHQIIAVYTGSENFSASASASTPIFIGADATVQATGVSVSHATIYPVTDGVGDVVTIRGRTFERTSITIAIVSSTGKRFRAFGLGTLMGPYSVAWNGRTSSGTIVPAGRYTVVQTLTDMRGNRLVVTTPLTVSLKQLFSMTDVQIRNGADFTREGTDGFGLVIARDSDDSVHVWGNVSPDWAFVTYEFTVPAATKYRTVRFEVVGEAQSGRTGALIAVLDASGEPVAEVRTGTANGRYSVTGGPTAVNARRVIATVTANGADRGALRVFSVRLVTTYQVFR